MRKITTYIVALFSVLVIFSSCKKEYETIEELDNKTIQAYKASNSSLVFKDTAGYSYSITDVGTGATVANTDSVYYSYVFKSASGTVHTQTSDLMIPGTLLGYTDRFNIGQSTYSFKPVREVLGKLKRGGKAIVVLPSRMAFGKNGLSAFGIGPNEILVVELGLYTYEKRHQVDAYEIQTFITRNNLTFSTEANTGIKYNISTPGTGTDLIGDHTTFVANYTLRDLSGSVYDSGTGATFRLGEVIKGWNIISGKLSAGGKIRIIVPSILGYGATGLGFIPPNTVLDFDIEITSVTKD